MSEEREISENESNAEEQNVAEVQDLPEELSEDQMADTQGGWGGGRNYRPRVRGC
ncbi:hypothetical protein [Paenibacillus xanthanilyticus]|uniref:Uncharacterized protein n=1 Tax=Paenibacillus xanthanilyticus TaxID=1783531 RepID=A0ABV8JVI7_9BACL